MQRAPGLSKRPLRTADPGPRGQAVGTLLGCAPGISRPRPPTVRLSCCPNCGDFDHQRVGPTPVTVRQPEFWIRTAWKSCPPAANLSRTSPPSAAGQCSPGGMSGSAQSAAARVRTWGAFAIVIPRGRISRNWLDIGLATTRSTVWAAAQSGTPGDVLTAPHRLQDKAFRGHRKPAPAGESLPSSRRHLLNVPHPLRRTVPRGCASRIYTASMAFTVITAARHCLIP